MLEELRQQFHRIAGHRGIRRYGANTLWMLAEKGCRLVFGFLVGIYVARQLGPARYGLLNYAISFVALFSVLATLGMDPVVVRELVRRPGKANSILGSALGLKAAGFAVMAFVVGIVLLVSPMSDSDRGLMAVILAGYGFQVFQIFDFSFQARVLGKYSAMSQIAALAVSSGFRLWFAWQGAPLWCFAAVESGYMALSAFGYALFYRKTGGCFRLWRFDRAEAAFLLRESLPLLLAGAAAMDGKPLADSQKVLLMHISDVLARGMTFDSADRTQVTNYVGGKPLGRHAQSTFLLPERAKKLYAIDLDGTRIAEIPLIEQGDSRSFIADTTRYPGHLVFAYELLCE